MAVAVPGVTKMRIWRTGSQECELIITTELRSQSLASRITVSRNYITMDPDCLQLDILDGDPVLL